MLKRNISLILIFCIIIGLLSGCASKSVDKAASEQSSAETTEKQDQGQVKEIPKVYFISNSGKLSATQTANSTKEALEAVRSYIIEQTGIEPVPIIPPKGSEKEKLNLLLASNEELDMFGGNWLDYYAKGAIQPINGYLDKYGADIKKMYQKTNMEDLWNVMTDKEGNIWGFPSGADLTMYPIWIRADWLEKLNLDIPTNLDELEAIFQAFKEQDPSGTGEIIPLACDLTGLKMCLAAGFIEGDFGCGNWMDSDGKIKPIEIHPGFKDFVARMADWYKKGYIYKEAFATNRDRYIELLKQNKIGATAYWASLISINAPYLQENVPEARYVVVENITGPKGKIETPVAAGTSGMLLTKKSKNPDAAVKLINWACADIENYLYMYGGIKDVHWRYVDEKENIVEALNQDYIGEYLFFAAFAHTVQYMFDDPKSRFEFEYLRKYATAYDRVKKAFDHGVRYDNAVLDEKVPNRGDIERMRTEEIIKFITGARPISEYDNFIEELYKAGLDKWIETYTELYKAETGK